MCPEPFEPSQPGASGPLPSPALRERVLRHCRAAMDARLAAQRRRQQRWRWGMLAGAAALLLINAAAERQSSARMAALVSGGTPVAAAAPLPAGAVDSLRTRRLLLAALLQDPNSL